MRRAIYLGKIRILGIGPYAGLCELLTHCAKLFPDVELDAHMGDLAEGVQIAKRLGRQYDVVLSRGGTAEQIERELNMPVVSIELSGYDMLRAMRLAQSYGGKVAIAGFPGITSAAKLVCSLLNFPAEIVTYEDASQVEDCLLAIKQKGCGLIVGDTVTITKGKQLGINGILLTSGEESVTSAISGARKYHKRLGALRSRISALEDAFSQSENEYCVMDEGGRLHYHNHPDRMENFAAVLSRLLPVVMGERRAKELVKIDEGSYLIEGKAVDCSGLRCALFEARPYALSPSMAGLVSLRAPGEGDFLSLDGMVAETSSMQAVISHARRAAKTALPVWICGESGTGRDTLAYAIHSEGPGRNLPFLTVNCDETDPRAWQAVLESPDSPLGEKGGAVYFRHIDMLPKNMSFELEKYIRLTSLHTRLKLIISSSLSPQDLIQRGALTDFSYKILAAHEFNLPSLQNRAREIPSLASIGLSRYNVHFGKQAAVFEDGAMELLCTYDWPGNIDELNKVLRELVLINDSSAISADQVEKLLLLRRSDAPSPGQSSFSQGKTLDEIEREIILDTLAQESFNQTTTAKRLGISRSTLWRKLRAPQN
jgi:transcriptional regulator with PAS, ATPase and Fis domain